MVGKTNAMVGGGGSPNIQSLSVTTNGTYTASGGVDGYSPVTVNVSGGGASDAVRFIDYDGTILHTYSANEFAALNALPANPSHTGLTAQGWNWTLADAKTYVADYGMLDIGQMYITDDGKTRIYISLAPYRRAPYLGICPNGTVVVDWGDNSATDTLTGTSLTDVQRVQHAYNATGDGDFVITLMASSGTFAIMGSSSNGTYLLSKNAGETTDDRVYQFAIKKIELGANVILDGSAFYNCSALQSITLPNQMNSVLPANIFRLCYDLTSVTIPSSISAISSYAFGYNWALASISLPANITSLPAYTFTNCFALSRITLPKSLVSLAEFVFNTCSSLVSVTLPNGFLSTGNSCFYNCYALQKITLPTSLTTIASSTFYGCHLLPNLTIPSSVTTIGSTVFSNNNRITDMTIPSGVTTLSASLFTTCKNLSSISIPDSVTSIDNYVFQNDYSLTEITIPSGVTSIGKSAFTQCTGMRCYHFLPTTPPTLYDTSVFTGIPSDCKIYVPQSSLSAYRTATNWSTYASYIVGE